MMQQPSFMSWQMELLQINCSCDNNLHLCQSYICVTVCTPAVSSLFLCDILDIFEDIHEQAPSVSIVAVEQTF